MGRTRQSRKDLPRRMYHYHGSYYFVSKDGKRTNLGKEYHEAIVKYSSIVAAPIGKLRIGAIMDLYVTEYLPKLKPRTQEDYTGYMQKLRPVFGDMWPEDLEPHHIYEYLDAREGKTQANREKALLSNVMNLCIRKGLIKENPCKQVKKNTETPADREVTYSEVLEFLPHCPPWLQAYLDLKTLVGFRQGDMLRVSVFSIRDDGLFCLTGKREKRILFKWSPALRQAIEKCKAMRSRQSDPRLFQITQRGFKSAWSRAMKKYQPEDKSKRFAENDLRAYVATEAIDAGMDATSMLGHSSDAVTRRHYIRGTRKVNPLM
jgi:integrase